MHVHYDESVAHAERLVRGLAVLGPNFLAKLCWWCNGTTRHNFECCDVCAHERTYGMGLGLLLCGKPAPESVVNQVLMAAESAP